ncbi:ROK family protein [Paenibacillus eucommiae]|uniref:Glucokinase n=1 Tax=Paenibacillus eucommiae TaxID=1355755 RepID=A0ABS4J0I0_9BACL|nr:ROK family protein [Paenibacillus eucommiae]MBP1993349.1 glucokinase [Paenibacillus eucommiae]
MKVIGIDLGGTKIIGGIIDEVGNMEQPIAVPTPTQLGREGILNALNHIIEQLLSREREDIQAIGIGSAGRIDRATGRVLYATDNLPNWTGTEVKLLLEAAHRLPVYVDNDVNAAALGEIWLGSACDLDHFMFVTLGTGVGGALIHNRQVIAGPQGGAGDIGHMILYPGGHPCNCGQRGCLEQYVSGTALNLFARQVNPQWNSRILMDKYTESEPKSSQIIQKFITDLSTAFASLNNLYEPQRIVIGGGIMDTHILWWDHLLAAVRQTASQPLELLPAQLGVKSGMLGAARLALDGLAELQ